MHELLQHDCMYPLSGGEYIVNIEIFVKLILVNLVKLFNVPKWPYYRIIYFIIVVGHTVFYNTVGIYTAVLSA